MCGVRVGWVVLIDFLEMGAEDGVCFPVTVSQYSSKFCKRVEGVDSWRTLMIFEPITTASEC